MRNHTDKNAIFRVDRFTVPASAREEFLAVVTATRDFLDDLGGCLQNVILEQPAGPGQSSIMTIVEWRDAEAFAAAKAAAAARYKAMGFNPGELIARLNITADFANYAVAA